MRHPLKRFTFSLAKELKMTQGELLIRMSADELFEWMAYESTLDKETRDKIIRELALERAAQLTEEQNNEAIKRFFAGLGGKNNGKNS